MKKFLNDLWIGLTHNADGTFSSTKFWQAVGYITSTYIVVRLAFSDALVPEVLLIYLGAVTAARSFQNYLTTKGKSGENFNEQTSYWRGNSASPRIYDNGDGAEAELREERRTRGATKTTDAAE